MGKTGEGETPRRNSPVSEVSPGGVDGPVSSRLEASLSSCLSGNSRQVLNSMDVLDTMLLKAKEGPAGLFVCTLWRGHPARHAPPSSTARVLSPARAAHTGPRGRLAELPPQRAGPRPWPLSCAIALGSLEVREFLLHVKHRDDAVAPHALDPCTVNSDTVDE